MQNKLTTVMFWIDQDEKQRLRLAAAVEGVSMSELIRRMIRQIPVVGKVENGKVFIQGE